MMLKMSGFLIYPVSFFLKILNLSVWSLISSLEPFPALLSKRPVSRKNLEHLCRYISRPSLSEARLSLNNKQVVYKLKTPYRNGTTPIVLDPLDFLSRLASLIPRPKIHFIRSHAVFAPNCKYRSLIVPQSVLLEKTSSKEKKKQKKSCSMAWAKLLKRVFDIDIQTCLKCGGADQSHLCHSQPTGY